MTITEAAARHLAGVLDNANAEPGVAVRLSPGERGWVMKLDETNPTDRSFELEGRVVLVLAEPADQALTGAQLDVERTEGGAKLSLREAPVEN